MLHLNTHSGGAALLDLLVVPGDRPVGADRLSDHLAVLSDPSLVARGLTFSRHSTTSTSNTTSAYGTDTKPRHLSSTPGSGSDYISLL